MGGALSVWKESAISANRREGSLTTSSHALEPSPPTPSTKPLSSPSTPSYGLLLMSSLGIVGCGVAAGLYRANRDTEGMEEWRKLPPSQQVKHWKRDPHAEFNPTRFAGKALAVGTVLCLSATGTLAFVVGRAMGVGTVEEFTQKLKVWAPAKRRELEAWLKIKPNASLERERERLAAMSYEEEIDYWERVVVAEEEGK
ncbi:hypothetical protein NGA_0272302 [Nannochloropsis gaditana CCMP526]|uniref:uncharacterized protein n=1 Tax=Nannochloropsis gaditana (strain CCMP526) TaxID=1093141 RepID=UPI00029F5A3B|nr:hypothetical protein NGA_0272302 [Nannochloropsis gaditana CCMP526]EKU22698.1 hypothetical protein NGA_0272302 [Nannochloropsis gaditana CCMP526]|eukprot:XP_005853657.1 hypothetical protein NGA_0272302 [Nannochloropsis gaditana CCMP526]